MRCQRSRRPASPAKRCRASCAAHSDFQERELIKRALLSAALAEALHRRGVPKPAAILAADMGFAAFYVDIVHEPFLVLEAVAAGT